MNQLLKDCVDEAFTHKNLITLWENRQSNQDIIGLDTELPIRYKSNDKGTRNVELMLQSQFGFYYKTIALIEDVNILFPREFDSLTNSMDFGNFKKHGMKSEINIMIGAFSMESLQLAIKNDDVEEYISNGGTYELIKASDGTMQTFVKQENSGIFGYSPLKKFYQSELDEEALSAFKFNGEQSGVFPTNSTHKWLETLAPQRLLEIFTIEQE